MPSTPGVLKLMFKKFIASHSIRKSTCLRRDERCESKNQVVNPEVEHCVDPQERSSKIKGPEDRQRNQRPQNPGKKNVPTFQTKTSSAIPLEVEIVRRQVSSTFEFGQRLGDIVLSKLREAIATSGDTAGVEELVLTFETMALLCD
ncbi:hypothetical protein Tco_1143840 [Tanacetum coccineum]